MILFLHALDSAGLTEREDDDVLDPWEEVWDPLNPEAYAERVRKGIFPGEPFRVLKGKEPRLFGEYRTNYLVVQLWRAFERWGKNKDGDKGRAN